MNFFDGHSNVGFHFGSFEMGIFFFHSFHRLAVINRNSQGTEGTQTIPIRATIKAYAQNCNQKESTIIDKIHDNCMGEHRRCRKLAAPMKKTRRLQTIRVCNRRDRKKGSFFPVNNTNEKTCDRWPDGGNIVLYAQMSTIKGQTSTKCPRLYKKTLVVQARNYGIFVRNVYNKRCMKKVGSRPPPGRTRRGGELAHLRGGWNE